MILNDNWPSFLSEKLRYIESTVEYYHNMRTEQCIGNSITKLNAILILYLNKFHKSQYPAQKLVSNKAIESCSCAVRIVVMHTADLRLALYSQGKLEVL